MSSLKLHWFSSARDVCILILILFNVQISKLYGVCTLWEKEYVYSLILILITFNVQIPKLYGVFSLWERRWIYWMHNIFSELITILKLTIAETKRDTLCPHWHEKKLKWNCELPVKLWLVLQFYNQWFSIIKLAKTKK